MDTNHCSLIKTIWNYDTFSMEQFKGPVANYWKGQEPDIAQSQMDRMTFLVFSYGCKIWWFTWCSSTTFVLGTFTTSVSNIEFDQSTERENETVIGSIITCWSLCFILISVLKEMASSLQRLRAPTPSFDWVTKKIPMKHVTRGNLEESKTVPFVNNVNHGGHTGKSSLSVWGSILYARN